MILQSLQLTGKRAFSFDNATKNIPPEVVKLRSKNSQGAAGQMVRTGVMWGTNHGCAYQMPLHGCPKTNKRRCGEWCRMLEEALWDGHAVSGTGSTGNTASHSRQPRAPSQRRRHNDQEYDIIYNLQGGDMWHITQCYWAICLLLCNCVSATEVYTRKYHLSA